MTRALGAVCMAGLLAGLAGGCRLDPYETGEPGHWVRGDGGGIPVDAGPDAEADACVAATEICDGRDNDCDGVVDNGFDLATDPRNCGACGVVCDLPFAFSACQDATCVIDHGQGEDGCLPGHWDVNGDPADGCEYACHVTNDASEVCDGQDNDCDGVADEDFDLQTDPNHCGQCNRVCVFFQGVGSCVAGQCTLGACRGGYVDKDGNPDNGCECQMALEPTATVCVEGQPGTCPAGQVCADLTGDGTAVCATSPPDLCDGVDSDCDGQIDEDSLLPTGGCYTHPVGCTETAPGVYDCVGACAPGSPACVGGRETCTGEVGPAAEVCDGVDNDCNGVVDDGFDLATDPANCGACGNRCTLPGAVPECQAGTCRVLVCLPGFWDVNGDPSDGCEYACTLTAGGVEQCGDGVDNDCDGQVDEGFDFASDPAHCGGCGNDCGLSRPFGTVVAGCAGGQCQYACQANHYDLDGDLGAGAGGSGCEYTCTVTGGGVESCDGVDNDCDGQVDEGFDKQTDPAHCGGCNIACASLVGQNAQVTGCSAGVCQFACLTGYVDVDGDLASGAAGTGCECQITNGGVESCDGVDNDCNGLVDDGPGGAPLERACYSAGTGCTETSPGVWSCAGPCRTGLQRCSGGAWGACQGEVGPVAEVCDGADNDCDGAADEDAGGAPLSQPCYTGPAGTEGVGPCRGGTQSCAGGVWSTCQGEVTPQTEVCNGSDDNCDGVADEGYDVGSDLANCGSCGYSCVAHAGAFSYATGCAGGTCGWACQPGHYDLDGDVGAGDAGNGCEYACVPSNGGVEKCGDGLDNDCNGGVDDGFDFQTDVDNCGTCGYRCADFSPSHAVPLACVGGACQYACASGWVDLDGDLGLGQAGNGCEYACTVTGAEVCDGQDNDCNGVVDDNPTDVGGPCGVTDVGPCQLGVWVCNSPNLECQGNIDPEPELCDGIDNDCDGTVDLPACLVADGSDRRVDTSAENSIQLDMDAVGQNVYLVWLDTAGGDADILFACSADGGVSWTGPTGIYTGGRDAVKPRVLADPSGSGRVYVAWESFNGGNREIFVRTAPGCGAGFAGAQRLDGDASDSLNIDLAADGSGRVAVVWEDFDEGTTIDDSVRNVWLATSSDHGATWTGAVRVNDLTSEPTSYATVPRVAYGAGGRVLVVWVDRVSGGGDIYLRGSDDGGASWSVPSTRLDVGDTVHATSKFPRIAASATGSVFVVWQDLRNSTSDIFLNRSDDGGATWLAADLQLDDEGAPHDSFEAELVLGRSGYVHVVWRDFRAGLPTVRVASSANGGVTWSPSVVASAGGGYVSEPQIAADGAGEVLVAWVDDRNGFRDVFLNFSLDDGATFQPSDIRMDTDLPAGGADSFGVRLAAGVGGVAYAAWIDTRRDAVNGDIYFNAAR